MAGRWAFTDAHVSLVAQRRSDVEPTVATHEAPRRQGLWVAPGEILGQAKFFHASYYLGPEKGGSRSS